MRIDKVMDYVQAVLARSVDKLPLAWHRFIVGHLDKKREGRVEITKTYPHLDHTLATLLAVRNLKGGKITLDHHPALVRRNFRHEMNKAILQKTPVHTIDHFTFASSEAPIRLRIYRVGDTPSKQCMVFFHGGSFCIGDLDTHDEPCRVLCTRSQCDVISVQYRLAPEAAFPAAFNDAVEVVTWLHSAQAQQQLEVSSNFMLVGDSAGGSLAVAAAAHLAITPYKPHAVFMLYPAVDYFLPTWSKTHFKEGLILTHSDLVKAFARYNPLGVFDAKDPRLSPLFSPNLAQLCPTMIVTAEYDLLRDEAEIMANTLKEKGVAVQLKRVATLSHGFISMTTVHAASKQAYIQAIDDFMRWQASFL